MSVADSPARQHWQTWRAILGAILVALTIRCFCCEIFQIPSGSMLPTLQVGDRILVNKFIYGPRVPFTARRLWAWRAPKRGEVAVFIAPPAASPSRQDFVKRIIGLPGDTIEVSGGRVFLNGHPMPRIYLGPVVQRDFNEHAGAWWGLSADAHLERFDPQSERQGGHSEAAQDGFTVLIDTHEPATSYDLAPTVVPEGHVFVMGDNRWHSSDSRRWGCVPTGALLGRASVFIFGWGEKGLTLGRFGRQVHGPVR